MTKNYQKHVFLILSALAIFTFMSTGAVLADETFDETKELEMDSWAELPITETKAGDTIDFDIQVTSGGSIDVFLLTAMEYVAYNRGDDVNFIDGGSAFDIKGKKYSYTFDKEGDYFIVLDNAEGYGGANPTGPVDVRLRLELTNVSVPEPIAEPIAEPVETEAPAPAPKTPGFGLFATVSALGLAMLVGKR